MKILSFWIKESPPVPVDKFWHHQVLDLVMELVQNELVDTDKICWREAKFICEEVDPVHADSYLVFKKGMVHVSQTWAIGHDETPFTQVGVLKTH